MLILFCAAVCILNCASAQDSYESPCQRPCLANGSCRGKGFHDTCYYTFPGKKTWEENRELCYTQNMTMAYLPEESFGEKFSLQDSVEEIGKDSHVWLGGKLRQLEEWTYLNGVPLEETHSNILATLHDADSKHQCGVIRYTKTFKEFPVLGVNKLDCYQERHFICRFVDWKNSPSFYVSETVANWYEARSRCKFLGGDLFHLNQWENINIIKDKLGQALNKTLFIGLTDRIWLREDGTEFLFKNWKSSGPDNGECLMLNMVLGSWKESNCSRKLHTVCQAERNPPTGTETATILAIMFCLAVLVIVGQSIYIIPFKCKKKFGRNNTRDAGMQTDSHMILLAALDETRATCIDRRNRNVVASCDDIISLMRHGYEPMFMPDQPFYQNTSPFFK